MSPTTGEQQLRARCREVLATIDDPELHRSIVELGMVRDLAVQARAVHLTLALTVSSCPQRAFFTEQVPARLRAALPELTGVELSLTTMDEAQRDALSGVVRRGVQPVGLAGSRTRVLAVASGKGGVGKSTVAVNLAVALAARGLGVGLLDADLWGYCVPRLLGATGLPTVVGDLLVPIEAHGVAALSLGNIIGAGKSVVWRGPMLHKALEQLLRDVHWDDRDILVIDLPPGTGDVSISLSQLLPGAASFLLVTTPPELCQEVAGRAGRMLADAQLRPAGVVVNMASHVCPSCGHVSPTHGPPPGGSIAEELDAPVLAEIPYEPALPALADASQPIVLADPGCPAAHALFALADQVAAQRDRSRRLLPLLT